MLPLDFFRSLPSSEPIADSSGHSSPSARAESMFKHSTPLLARHCRNVKRSSLQLQDKPFLHCFGGKGNRKDLRIQHTVPSVYAFIFRPKVRDGHQPAFTAAPRAASQSDVLPCPPDEGDSTGFRFGPQGPGRNRAWGTGLQHSRQAVFWPWLWPPVERSQGGRLADDSAPSLALLGGEQREPPRSPRRSPVAPAEPGGWSSSAGFPAQGEEGEAVWAEPAAWCWGRQAALQGWRRGGGRDPQRRRALQPGREPGTTGTLRPAGVCGVPAFLPGGAAAGGLGLPVEEKKAARDALQPPFSRPVWGRSLWKSAFPSVRTGGPCGSRVRKGGCPHMQGSHPSVQLCSVVRVRFNFVATLIRKVQDLHVRFCSQHGKVWAKQEHGLKESR